MEEERLGGTTELGIPNSKSENRETELNPEEESGDEQNQSGLIGLEAGTK